MATFARSPKQRNSENRLNREGFKYHPHSFGSLLHLQNRSKLPLIVSIEVSFGEANEHCEALIYNPCPHAQDTTAQTDGIRNAERTSARRRGPSPGSSEPRLAMTDGWAEAGVPSKWDGGRGADQGGSTARCQETPKEPPSGGNGDRLLTAAGDGGRAGSGTPRDQTPRIGDPACCPGEALLW